MSKKVYRMEIYGKAVVKTTIQVEASGSDEAEKIAADLGMNIPEGVVVKDAEGNPIEGIGDLVWTYESMEPEDNEVLDSHILKVLNKGK